MQFGVAYAPLNTVVTQHPPELIYLVFPWGKTMNSYSYRRNHDIRCGARQCGTKILKT